MITVSAPKKVREKLTRDYQRKLEDENTELRRRLIATRDRIHEMREALSLHEQLRDLAHESGYYAGRMEQAACSTVTDYSAVLKGVIAKRNALSEKMVKALDRADCGHGDDSASDDCLICALEQRCADYGEQIRARLEERA